MAKNPLIRFLDFLANMGLTVRDDPPKVIDVAARTWGRPVDDFALSIEQLPQDDPQTPPTLSVVIRNVSANAQTLTVPGWLHFYRIEIDAELSPFGRQLLKPERATERITITLKPGEPSETQVPVGAMFSLRRGVSYPASVSCTLPNGAVLTSNSSAVLA